jgi:hypothetical protein
MAKKPAARQKTAKRKPPVAVPLPFGTAIDGILGMTPATARKVNKR